jgi:DNA polymerase alpha subunit A
MADSARRTRTRGPGAESSARLAALERLKAMRSGGARAAQLSVKIEEPIYETVSEDAYKELVEKRRADGESFIVDDGDLGYADDGHEEDWTTPAGHSSEDDLSDADGVHERRPRKKNKPSNSGVVKKPPAPTSIVKERLSTIFTSAVTKKGKGSGPLDRSVLDSVLAEVAPDENDWEERRRRRARVPALVPDVQIKAESTMVCLTTPKAEVNLYDSHDIGGAIYANTNEEDENLNLQIPLEREKPSSGQAVVTSEYKEAKEEAEADQKGGFKSIAKVEADKTEHVERNREVEWKEGEVHLAEARMAIDSRPDSDDKSEFELNTDASLPFYIIDAYEEVFSANSGTIYLFGKVNFSISCFSF